MPNAASRIPATCLYFPSTIAAIEEKRFNGLANVIRKEVADAAGYAVFEGLAHSGDLRANPSTVAGDALKVLQGAVLPRAVVTKSVTPAAGSAQTYAGLTIDPKDPTAKGAAPERLCYFDTKADTQQRAHDIAVRQAAVTDAQKAASSKPSDGTAALLKAANAGFSLDFAPFVCHLS